jgi:nucleoside-diphosphate-sugar epimerase
VHVFVTGGSGLTGPAIVAELIAAGHTVTGLARSDEAAARLRGLGAETLTGALEDLDTLQAGAKAADGVIHMAFGGSFADPRGPGPGRSDRDRDPRPSPGRVGQAVRQHLRHPRDGSGRVTAEDDAPDPESIGWFRIPGEQACLAFADQGVRSSVVRLAPTVHGPGDYGFIPMLVAAARKNGVSAYIGDGANRWPATSEASRALLGWTPVHPTLLHDIETGDYCTA